MDDRQTRFVAAPRSISANAIYRQLRRIARQLAIGIASGLPTILPQSCQGLEIQMCFFLTGSAFSQGFN
jgi:hypothetical protein